MMVLIVIVAIALAVALALYSSTIGEGSKVTEKDIGGSNSFEAYYGKNAHRYGGGQPCEECGRQGCIGVGQCRCRCHLASQAG